MSVVKEENPDTPGGTTVQDVDNRLRQLIQACSPFHMLKNHNLLVLYLLIVPSALVPSAIIGYDASMFNGLQAVKAWDKFFNHPRGAVLGFISCVLYVGAICSVPFVAYVMDKWGRRWCIAVGCLILLFGAALQSGSINLAMFLSSRFILGFGLVFCNAAAPIVIGELAHPRERMVVTALFQSTFYLGSITAAWVTFGTFRITNNWSWRIPSMLQIIGPLISLAGLYFLPESPRWLFSKGRAEEAKEVLIYYHANNNPDDELVNLEILEIQGIIEREMAVTTTWTTLFKTPGNRRRALIMVCLGVFSQWSGNGLVSYYLVRVLNTIGITDSKTQSILNGSLAIFNWITAVICALLTNYLKRRTQFMISVCGMLAIFIAETVAAGLFNEQGNKAAGTAVIPFLFLFYIFYNLAFNALVYSYPTEVWPFATRAKGMMILQLSAKCADFVNALVNPIGLAAIGWKFYNVYVGWLVIECLVIYFLFVETKGPSLEAIAAKFDKEDPVLIDGQHGSDGSSATESLEARHRVVVMEK